MDFEKVISGQNIEKRYKGFKVSIDNLEVPKGFATALIGENGAGKTTLIDILSGLRMNYKGNVRYFDEELDIENDETRNRIGYTGAKNIFLPGWTCQQVKEVNSLLFDGFNRDAFNGLIDELVIPAKNVDVVKNLSEGNIMKLMLASALARDTDLLLLDEPASPLDPLMRDKLCDLFRRYLNEGDGRRSILFSTHNVSDMEAVTDYVLLMQNGQIIEKGFVEELKEKYVLVSGDENYDVVANCLIGGSHSQVGYNGLVRSSDLEKLAGINVSVETPNLSQICVNLLKQNSLLK